MQSRPRCNLDHDTICETTATLPLAPLLPYPLTGLSIARQMVARLPPPPPSSLRQAPAVEPLFPPSDLHGLVPADPRQPMDMRKVTLPLTTAPAAAPNPNIQQPTSNLQPPKGTPTPNANSNYNLTSNPHPNSNPNPHTPTPTLTLALTLTLTLTPTVTLTPTLTLTPTVTLTPTLTLTPIPDQP